MAQQFHVLFKIFRTDAKPPGVQFGLCDSVIHQYQDLIQLGIKFDVLKIQIKFLLVAKAVSITG